MKSKEKSIPRGVWLLEAATPSEQLLGPLPYTKSGPAYARGMLCQLCECPQSQHLLVFTAARTATDTNMGCSVTQEWAMLSA